MKIEDFKKTLYIAYQKEDVSSNFINSVNKLCKQYQINETFSEFTYNKIEQPNLIFNGPSERALNLMKEKQPKISIIVPTYNRSEFLIRCVDSVLEQDYENLEIIIINDCSTDNTSEVVKSKYGNNNKVVYIENETNLGPGGNRQKAYLKSKGEYIIFADDDDFYIEPTFFSKAIALFFDYSNLSMVCANSIIFNDISNQFDFHPLTFCNVMDKEKFLFGFGDKYRKPNSTFPTVFKKSILDQADFANMKMMNDTSIYMRAACFGDVCMMKDWVGVYWVHETNISKCLPFDFIIENLDEKNNIYELVCKQFKTSNPDWLLTQQMITITYFLNSRRLSLPKFFKLRKWIKQNGGEVKREMLNRTTKAYLKTLSKK